MHGILMKTSHANLCRWLPFLDDLIEILISCLDNTIHLGSIRRRIWMLNFLFGTDFNNQFPIKILNVISYQFFWQAVMTNKILLNELSILEDNSSSNINNWSIDNTSFHHDLLDDMHIFFRTLALTYECF